MTVLSKSIFFVVTALPSLLAICNINFSLIKTGRISIRSAGGTIFLRTPERTTLIKFSKFAIRPTDSIKPSANEIAIYRPTQLIYGVIYRLA